MTCRLIYNAHYKTNNVQNNWRVMDHIPKPLQNHKSEISAE
jgi:hypothetical protein